ncbi:MAG: FKBP-type peptidyl-prolyl cis-trans isomerase [Pseudomonadota bacterium]
MLSRRLRPCPNSSPWTSGHVGRLQRASCVALLGALLSACQPPASEAPTDAAEADAGIDLASASESVKASYVLGFNSAQATYAQLGDFIDADAYALGVGRAFAGEGSEVSQADSQAAMQALRRRLEEQRSAGAAETASAGAAFLAENGKREGVVTTASGLQYEVMTAGDGPKPGINDSVKTHYHGTLIDGTVFDSSVQRDKPATFPLQGVIRGWTEALQLMPVGSKYKLFIPPNLAYGERATGSIPPQSTLIFEVELLEILNSATQ